VNVIEDDTPILQRPSPSPPPNVKNGPILVPWKEVQSIELNRTQLKPHDAIELSPKGRADGDFLVIRHIIENQRTKEIRLRGLLFRRAKYLPVPDRKTNEICMLLSRYEDDNREALEQGLEEISAFEFLRTRQLIITRDPYPLHSFRDRLEAPAKEDEEMRKYISDKDILVCRFVFTTVFEKTPSRNTKKIPKATQGELRRVYITESDKSEIPTENDFEFIKANSSSITYGSGCAGAGGDITGAVLAGLNPVFGWDKDCTACATLRQNYPDLKVYERHQWDIIHGTDAVKPSKLLHILHLSWPCCFWSPAHTVQGRNDQENFQAIFATKAHLEYFKPLYHTQEQTSGLFTHHPLVFWNLISDITSCGYNVRWKVLNFQGYGLAASRKRLIILAAKDTVPLARFPKPTHGRANSGLQRFKSTWEAVGRIPDTATYHWDMMRPYQSPREPYDPKITYAKCITTSGGGNAHWSGLYPLTPRHMAKLQTFRNSYKFCGERTQIRKQVGNALPPVVWARFVGEIKETLQKWMAGKIDETGRRVSSDVNDDVYQVMSGRPRMPRQGVVDLTLDDA
jgi:DNA (cytosine-5)-methyltransferase 1